MRTAAMEGKCYLVEGLDDDGNYHNIYEMKPYPDSYSVKIFRPDIREKLDQVDAAVTSVLRPVLLDYGLVCKTKWTEFELSVAADRKPPQVIEFRRAVDALVAVAEGVDVELALKILVHDMEVAIFDISNSWVQKEVWRKRRDYLSHLYDDYELHCKVPCALFEQHERSIIVVATPLVCRLMRRLIVSYIGDDSADFKKLAAEHLKLYERFKYCPDIFFPTIPSPTLSQRW